MQTAAVAGSAKNSDAHEMLVQAEGPDGAAVRAAAVQLLAAWAAGGVANCGNLAVLGAGPVVGHLLKRAGAPTVACTTHPHTAVCPWRECMLLNMFVCLAPLFRHSCKLGVPWLTATMLLQDMLGKTDEAHSRC